MSDIKKKPTQITITPRARADSDDPSTTAGSRKPPSLSLKSPRAARFAEATAVSSPIDVQKTNHFYPQPQVADLGFGYVNQHQSVEMPDTEDVSYYAQPPKSPLKSPLKSAMKTPGGPRRDPDGLLSPTFKPEAVKSPTFQEEQVLEKHEESTDKEQAKDLKVKVRVRIAKFFLRGINFSCSLIVLGMLSSTFAIFNATKHIPARNSLPPWAANQMIWPQVTLLCIACISLFACLIVFWGYWRGGHRRAEKAAIYYTAFAVVFFIFSVVMWMTGLILLQQSKSNSNNKDMWGWSCVDNTRKHYFENEVAYDLVCRLQNWSLVCCIIEVVVEVLTIIIYGIVFYRFWSKRQLRKSMAVRDRARSDLYLAQLRAQSAPNTPGLGPLSPRDGGYRAPNLSSYVNGPDAEDGMVQYADPDTKHAPAQPFQLQAPPIRVTGATPKMQQLGFTPISNNGPAVAPPSPLPAPRSTAEAPPLSPLASPTEKRQEHFGAAPGEEVYDDVPIPGAYQPLSPTSQQFQR